MIRVRLSGLIPATVLRESGIIFAGFLPVTLSARIYNAITINGYDWYRFIYLQDLLADFCSIVLLIIISFLILLFIPGFDKIHRYLQGLLMFLVSLVYIASRKYFYVYKTEFDWFHLGHEQIETGLLKSITAEMDLWVYSSILLAMICSLIFIYILGKVRKPDIQLTVSNSLAFNLILVFSIIMFLNSGNMMVRHNLDEDPEGNILINLFVKPLIQSGPTIHTKELSEIDRTKRPAFNYRFSTDAISTKKIKGPLPFRQKGKKFNIVFYVMESMSYKYVGKKDPNGIRITPNWDKLSNQSFLFQNHYANNPLSINALFNILTSSYSLPSDRWAAKDYPDLPLLSLPQILYKNGYRNAVYHSGYFAYAGAGRFLKNRNFEVINDVFNLRSSNFKEVNWGVDDRAFIAPSIEFATQNKKSPFFIIYLPISPHHPYETPDKKYPIQVPEDLKPGHGNSFKQYLNSLHYSDMVLAETIDAYKKAGLMKDTLFFIFADHGEAFGQHKKNYNHPFYIYEENVHVPFMIYNPELIKSKIVINDISRHIDIMPTVLDFIGIKLPDFAEGKSLLDSYPSQFAALHTSWRNNLTGLRDGNYKYIFNQMTQKEELYNLLTDKAEKVNLVKQKPALARKFKNKLKDLELHQKQFFEFTLNKKINWSKRQNKENF